MLALVASVFDALVVVPQASVHLRRVVTVGTPTLSMSSYGAQSTRLHTPFAHP